MILSWANITQTQITKDILNKMNIQIDNIYNKMNFNKKGKIYCQDYEQAMIKNPDLLEIFEFLNMSVEENIFQQKNKLKIKYLELIEYQLFEIQNLIKNDNNNQKDKNRKKSVNNKNNINSQNNNDNIFYQQQNLKQLQINYNNIDKYKIDQNKKKSKNDKFNFGFKSYPQKKILNKSLFYQQKQKFQENEEHQFLYKSCQKSNQNEDLEQNLIQRFMQMDKNEMKKTLIKVCLQIEQVQQTFQNLKKVLLKKQQQNIQKQEFLSDINLQKIKLIKQNSFIENSNQEQKINGLIIFGHQDWNLVLNMMIGIRTSVFQNSYIIKQEIQQKDFKDKFIYELLPKKLPIQKQQLYKAYIFYDYYPCIFQYIRFLYNISDEQYLKSIGLDQLFISLAKGDFNGFRQLTSQGKSGSFFYYTSDGKITIKTISKSEFKYLKAIIQNYFNHLKTNKQSLIIKFFGLHKIKVRMKKNLYQQAIFFVVMGNIFDNCKDFISKYDLKGSIYGRKTNNKNKMQIIILFFLSLYVSIFLSKDITLKDLDFIENKQKILINYEKYIQFMDIIQKDAEFFAQNNIMDYSLLVGIHQKNLQKQYSIKQNMSQIISSDNKFIYYFGIIDILTCFNNLKKIEYFTKKIIYGNTISSVPPQQYKDRFINFIKKIFVFKQDEINNNIQIDQFNIFIKDQLKNNNGTVVKKN
ncbi:phosphatidylinositol-4-phosphate 5-kinase, putative [Ichthyophthirius multifiliis]|uniref:Phosphatidylinositol-4-phosphate 5-kinase, putative n=1 Tax=Ichthyophthirius multifiliis TaxID=5932 RepID=G0QIP4_ICHMU|nr:phosphatidylinositol-4-phosphate 5-kinase, putative [Ichthyophthirius multifiliis]EGR34874.1 phosphatidylinositol-4-phosphate 5-kinase, putative [Ichthyophthirius multifiliis]|eukprot:XP_004040178.1 phosphatidylinositol-4-phosphate 5-kinase, putative [Ichthyophthirius multifiliis]